MKYLILATVASALPNYKLPADHPDQPARLAACTMLLCDTGLKADTVRSFLVKPDGWKLAPETIDHTGYTMSDLELGGVDVREPLQVYATAVDDGYTIVSYNAAHHCKVMRGEMRRVGMEDRYDRTDKICVMRSAMGHVIKEGGKKGFPKLTDCISQFEIEFDPRKADGMAMATLEVARNLVKLGADLNVMKTEAA